MVEQDFATDRDFSSIVLAFHCQLSQTHASNLSTLIAIGSVGVPIVNQIYDSAVGMRKTSAPQAQRHTTFGYILYQGV
jgi:hypothetical protein